MQIKKKQLWNATLLSSDINNVGYSQFSFFRTLFIVSTFIVLVLGHDMYIQHFVVGQKGRFWPIKAFGCVLEMLWHHKYDSMMVKYVRALQAWHLCLWHVWSWVMKKHEAQRLYSSTCLQTGGSGCAWIWNSNQIRSSCTQASGQELTGRLTIFTSVTVMITCGGIPAMSCNYPGSCGSQTCRLSCPCLLFT